MYWTPSMGHGGARSRDQYEPVSEGGKRRPRCNCLYGFLVFLTVVIILGVIGGAAFAGWLVYSMRPETDGTVTDTYSDYNGTEAVSGEGGDIQYAKVIPYDPEADKGGSTLKPSPANPRATQIGTTPGTAARILEKDDSQEEMALIAENQLRANVTDDELKRISSVLWRIAQPHMLETGRAYELNLGAQINSSTKSDESPDRLFLSVQTDLRQLSPTYTTFLRLLDNYNYVTKVEERYTEVDKREMDDFLDEVIASSTMRELHRFLVKNGLASKEVYKFKKQLWNIWFDLYSRSPKYNTTDSSGFEHVFVGEIRKNKVIGFHNWVQFYLQEQADMVNYIGFFEFIPPRMVNVRMRWHEKMKKMTSFFVGTPPEYDLAVYTLCILTRTGRSCPIAVDDDVVRVQSFEVKHMEGIQVASIFLAI